MLPYKVTKKYEKGPEQLFAKFEKSSDAKQYIQFKLEEDAGLRLNIIYSLYELGELMGTFDQASQNVAPSGASSQTSSNAARLTPLQTTLRPTGMPFSSFNDAKEEGKK